MSIRDSWATPPWLTALLPAVDLDPCSNDRSTVRADRAYDLARGEDGLALPWSGSLWINPPYSDVLPWAERLIASPDVTACGVLINVDPSTRWWRLLTGRLSIALLLTRRVQFDPPPGVQSTTNNKAQAILMDHRFHSLCTQSLLARGDMWHMILRAPDKRGVIA